MKEAKYFRLRLNEPKVFIKLMEILGKLLDLAELSIASDSLKLVAMDASHVLNINLTLPGAFFNEYMIYTPQTIRLDLKELNRVLKRSREELLFLMDSSTENKLLAQFQKDKNKRNFKVKLQDPIDAVEPIREIDYEAALRFDAGRFAELIGDALLASDYATFTVESKKSEDAFIIDAIGDDTEFNAEIRDFLEKPTIPGTQQAVYSLEYLSDIAKLEDISSVVNLQFSNEMPLELTYSLEKEGVIVLTLAPRVTEEEETAAPAETEEKSPETEEAEFLKHIHDVTKENNPDSEDEE